MTDPLRELLRRADDPAPRFTADDLLEWPDATRSLLERSGVLTEAEPAQYATCDSCAIEQGGEVIFSHVPGRPVRAFLPCPENGRVEIDPAQLLRWVIQPRGLARAVAATVGVTSTVEERSAERMWKLDSFRAADRVWLGFLAVGLTRPDAASVVASVAELRAANAVVFVPVTIPTPTIWGKSAPIVLALVDLPTLADTGLSLDRLALDSALTPAATPIVPTGVVFPTPLGSTWDQVEIIVEDLHLVIRVGEVARRYGYAEAGFENRKTGTPDQSWRLLTLLAQNAGVLNKAHPARQNAPSLKEAVNVLRTRLRRLLALDDDPFLT